MSVFVPRSEGPQDLAATSDGESDAAAGRAKILVITVVWGDWHIDALINYALPSLLAPGNFPHLALRHDLELLVYTTPADKSRIETADSIRRAADVVAVRILPDLSPEVGTNVHVFHADLWLQADERAKREGSFAFHLPPDSVFADGAGVTLSRLLAQGKKCIFWYFPRALDTMMPALRAYRMPDGAIAIPPRALVALNLEHLHPLSKAFVADSKMFPAVHPEMILWPVPGEGVLMRSFAGEARVFDPGHFELTSHRIVSGKLDDGELAVISDSDDLYTAALTPLRHNAHWYRPGTASPSEIARYWTMNYDGTSNDFVAAQQIRVHPGERTDALWRAREMRANLFMSLMAAARESVRVMRVLYGMESCSWAMQLLDLASQTSILLRSFPRSAPTIVFIPVAAAMQSVRFSFNTPDARAEICRFLRHHAVVGDTSSLNWPDRIDESGGRLSLRSAARVELSVIRARDGRMTVNGIPFAGPPIQAGTCTVIPIAGILDRAQPGFHG